MKEIEDNKLDVTGGGVISGTLINAFTSGIKVILEVGRSLGTAIRRINSHNMCSL